MLGRELALSATPEGPVLDLDGIRLLIGEESLVVDGEDEVDFEVLGPILPVVAALHRLFWFLRPLPMRSQREDGRTWQLSAREPFGAQLYVDGVLHLELAVYTFDAQGVIENVASVSGPFLELSTLGGEGASTRSDDWHERARSFLATAEDVTEVAGLFPLVPEESLGEDPGYAAFLASLGLEGFLSGGAVTEAVSRVRERFASAAVRFHEQYGLLLPSDLIRLAALVEILGELPQDPPGAYWEADPGAERGGLWLDQGLGMRPSGLLHWLAPGGLSRPLLQAACDNGEKTLDPRLDWRFRRDAPQFVTFASGDSDGSHWGLWYDHPDYYPVIAHNWARDCAETAIEAPSLGMLLHQRLLSREEELRDEVDPQVPESWELLRAMRVVGQVWEVLEQSIELPAEPRCPWPRTTAAPIGSPPLALPPGSGTIPASVPGFGAEQWDNPAARASEIVAVWATMRAGQPAHALALGLYLHWLDADEGRTEAADLLAAALRAIGAVPLAAILEVHVRWRDLPSVAVFGPIP